MKRSPYFQPRKVVNHLSRNRKLCVRLHPSGSRAEPWPPEAYNLTQGELLFCQPAVLRHMIGNRAACFANAPGMPQAFRHLLPHGKRVFPGPAHTVPSPECLRLALYTVKRDTPSTEAIPHGFSVSKRTRSQ